MLPNLYQYSHDCMSRLLTVTEASKATILCLQIVWIVSVVWSLTASWWCPEHFASGWYPQDTNS